MDEAVVSNTTSRRQEGGTTLGRRRLTLRTLGELALYSDPGRPPLLVRVKPLLVPTMLATLPGHVAERARLAEMIWGHGSAKKARQSLRQALVHLTHFGQGAGVRSDGERVLLDLDAVRVDLLDFDRALAGRRYRDALSLHHGRFVQPLESTLAGELEECVETQNDRIRAALDVAYAQVIADRVAAGAMAEALRYAEEDAAANPLHEPSQLALVRTLRAAGLSERALQVYEGYRSLLERTLGQRLDSGPREALQRLREEATRELRPSRIVYVDRPAEGAPPAPRAAWRAVAAWSALGVAAVAGAAGTSWGVASARGVGGDDPLWTLEAEVPVALGEDAHVLRVRGGKTELSPPTELSPRILVSPGRNLGVARRREASGRNLDLVDGSGRFIEHLTSSTADEYVHAWSPDSRAVLITRSRGGVGGRGHTDVPLVLDIETRDTRVLAEVDAAHAAWSPDGLRVALEIEEGGRSRVAVLPVGGGEPVTISPDSASAFTPAWSPQSRRIAMAVGRPGDTRVGTWSASAGRVRFLDAGPGPTDSPLWLGEDLLAFLAHRGDSTLVRVVEYSSGRSRTLASLPTHARLVRGRGRADVAWLDSVVVLDVPDVVTPGQRLVPRAALIWSDGRREAAVPGLVRWTFAGKEREAGSPWVVGAPGTLAVVGAIPGWRATRHVVRIAELDSVAAEVLYTEDWSDSLSAERWLPFGDPEPYVTPSDGPGRPRRFRGNGDRNYLSGVVSARAFGIEEGLTVEALVTTPFDGGDWQNLYVGLYGPEPPRPENRRTLGLDRGVWVDVSSRYGGLVIPDRHITGLDLGPGWHRLAVQASATGTVSVVWDGEMVWRGEQRNPLAWGEEGASRTHVLLAANSDRTTVEIGPVTVYRGERFVLGEPGGGD